MHGAWPLLFVMLVPWLLALDAQRSWRSTLLLAWLMAVAYTGAAFFWFGAAIGSYTQIGTAAGIAVLMVLAPLFQPQFVAFALARRWMGQRHGPWLRALAGSAAWLAGETLLPRVLDDTLGSGLHPSRLLRQAADLGGVAGLTLLLLLANEAVLIAIQRRSQGSRALARPLVGAVAVPLLLAAYGLAALAPTTPPGAPSLRMGLVQSNIVDYERLRREKGAEAVVREVLETHVAMTHDAVERQGAQAVLWAETVYPTTFGAPKSEAGAEFDRAILQVVDAARVPFVFGTYERDAQGEYNAAAFVEPGRGLLGFYRKTRLFPFTEHVPAWLDSPALRSLLPWTGHWRPGNGARPMPLRLANGREVPVLPLICLDDMDTGLVVDGTRLGAQVILTMSNDAWFATAPLGAQLHLAAAAMRSVETRLPQFRVTNSGYSAVIDAQGNVLNETRMGERTLVIGEVPVREPPRTLLVAWGPWVGPFATLTLALLVLGSTLLGWVRRLGLAAPEPGGSGVYSAEVAVMPPAARLAAGALRAIALGTLLAMAALMLFGDGGLLAKPLAQIRVFLAGVLVPELAAWMVMRAFSARAAIEPGALVLARGAYTLRLPLADIATVQAWRWPLPSPGATVGMASGTRHALAGADAIALRAAMGRPADPPSPADHYAHATLALRAEPRRLAWLAHPLTRFVLLPFLIAIPAFRLHQHIAYGSTFGEWLTFGAQAWLTGFALWWAGWAIAIAIVAAVLRMAIEAATLVTLRLQPDLALPARRLFERLGLALLFLGPPAWWLARVLLA